MRRSEASALYWADIADETDGDGVMLTVRRSKTNQKGETKDVRFVKDGVARAPPDAAGGHNSRNPDRAAPLSPQMVGAAVHGGGQGTSAARSRV